MPWAAAVIGGSVLGVLTNAWLVTRGIVAPAPLTTPRMAARAFEQLAAGPSAIMHQAFSGIPVKVYARAAGAHHIDLWHLAGWTLLERGCASRWWGWWFGCCRSCCTRGCAATTACI